MKVKGIDFKDWYENGFPVGYYFDCSSMDEDMIHDLNGNWLIKDEKTYDTDELGYLAWEGDEEPLKELTLEKSIREYVKNRNFKFLTFKVPRTIADTFELQVNQLLKEFSA